MQGGQTGKQYLLGLFAALAILSVSTAWARRTQANAPNTWTSAAPMPGGRWYPAAAAADGKVYVFGGSGCGNDFCATFDAYDPVTNAWRSMGNMPVELGGLPSATAGPDGNMYIYGTVSSTSGPPPAPGGVLLIYDPRSNTWTRQAGPPGVDDTAILVAGLDGRIYAVGGRVKGNPVGTLSAYDPLTHRWTTLKPLPAPRQFPGVAVGPDGRIYVIGGMEFGGFASVVDRVDAYDPKSNSWSSAAPLPTPRSALQAVTGPDGRLYAIGGNGRCFTAPCNAVEAYEVRTNRWTAVASLPHPRDGFAAGAGPDDRIYVVGGAKSLGPPLDLETAVDAYTVVPANQPLPEPTPGPTSVTRELAPMPTARDDLGAATSGGAIYAIGGETVAEPQPGASPPPRVLRAVEAYNPQTNTWTEEPPLPAPRMVMGVTTGPDGRIYVLGGVAAQPQPDVTSVAGLSTVFIYDPGTRRWSRGKPMPDGRYNLAAVTGKDGRIYTIGGATICYDLCAGTGTVRAFNPRTNTWTTLAPLPVSCLPPAAAVAPDGRIYVFGCAPPSDSFLVYDPTRNRWTKVAGMPHRRFSGFAAATAGDGRIVLAGGCLITSATQSGFNGYCGSPSPVDAYDPRTNRWQTIGLTLNARRWPAATTGPDGRVYVVGGSGDGNGKLLEVIRSGRSG